MGSTVSVHSVYEEDSPTRFQYYKYSPAPPYNCWRRLQAGGSSKSGSLSKDTGSTPAGTGENLHPYCNLIKESDIWNHADAANLIFRFSFYFILFFPVDVQRSRMCVFYSSFRTCHMVASILYALCMYPKKIHNRGQVTDLQAPVGDSLLLKFEYWWWLYWKCVVVWGHLIY